MLQARALMVSRVSLLLPTLSPARIEARSFKSGFQISSVTSESIPSIVAGSSPSVEEETNGDATEKYVEIGVIAGTHGLHGELNVHSLTDFPTERFEKPGVRWLRVLTMGKPSIRRVELLKGRARPGKRPSWLVSLSGINTPEEGSELVGSMMLVHAADDERPPLVDDEYYVPDLVGMSVVLQESGEEIGVIVDVFNFGGGNDLLRVARKSQSGFSTIKESLLWIPFVKEIVPIVDKNQRRVEINPPTGLLELNVPLEKNDKQKQGLKQRRKRRERISGIKKKLASLGQMHVLAGLNSGGQDQRQALLDDLLSIDFALFGQALKSVRLLQAKESDLRPKAKQFLPVPPAAYPKANWESFDEWLGIPTSVAAVRKDRTDESIRMERWWREGLQLVADGRVAVVVLAGGQSSRLGLNTQVKGMLDLGLPNKKSLFQIQAESLLIVQKLASLVSTTETCPDIPWILMTSDSTDAPTREYFEDEEYFGLDKSQVMFLKQDSFPCIKLDKIEDQHQIIMETPWKIAKAPTGNGSLFNALHSHGLVDQLSSRGIDYIQVYAVDNALVRVADPVFFGYVNESKADIGVKVVSKLSAEEAVGIVSLFPEGTKIDVSEGDSIQTMSQTPKSLRYGVLEYTEMPESFCQEEIRHPESSQLSDVPEKDLVRSSQLRHRAAHICVNIFSVDYLRMLEDPKFELEFHPAVKTVPVMEIKDGEMVSVVPNQPNGIKLERFIFDSFKFCSPEKVVLLEVSRDEEFAPVKNADGPGVRDSPASARDMALSLYRRISSSSSSRWGHSLARRLLVSYMGGHLGEDLSELLTNTPQNQTEITDS